MTAAAGMTIPPEVAAEVRALPEYREAHEQYVGDHPALSADERLAVRVRAVLRMRDLTVAAAERHLAATGGAL